MSNIVKLKAAVGRVPGSRFHGYYEGRYEFEGIAAILRRADDLLALGAALAKEGADQLIGEDLHIDNLGRETLVAWDIELFSGYVPEDDGYNDDEGDDE